MSNDFGTDPQKMLDWDKKLGEQSDFVKKAIDPLLTWGWAYTQECMDGGIYGGIEDYKYFWETKNKENPNFVKEHILKNFTVGDLYDRLGDDVDKMIAVNKLKELGIEGDRHGDKIDHVYDDDYVKSLDQELYFKEQQEKYFKKENLIILEEQRKPQTYEQTPISDRQLETAQKTGYVQGVCESVLAFNTDENRKIMSEDTMAFLSKKILSEMHVTKDMAQKFANPETYKALEKQVFAPAREQQLDQTQSQGITR